MALLMAKRYGANVTNYGLIPEQNRVFEERIRLMGLDDKIKNVVRNARSLGEEKGRYDTYVSLGVIEHAGKARLEEWIAGIAACLKDEGVGVVTFAGHVRKRTMEYFVGKYIWRGCYLPSLAEMILLMEKYNLEVVDVESVRRHYADTMRIMLSKLNEHWDKIQAIDPNVFDEKFRRTWNVYYAGASEAMYAKNFTQSAYQVTFVKGRGDEYPRTRDFLYVTPFDLSDMHEYEVPLRE